MIRISLGILLVIFGPAASSHRKRHQVRHDLQEAGRDVREARRDAGRDWAR